MTGIDLVTAIVCAAALFGVVNAKLVHWPDPVGIAAFSMLSSLIVVVIGRFHPFFSDSVRLALQHLDFSDVLLHVLLGPLLFAGSLQISVPHVRNEKWLIVVMSTAGLLIAVALVGWCFFAVTALLGMQIPWPVCFLFGALMAPTDPVAVVALLHRVGISKALETRIAAESLFNDGTGVVVFLTTLGIAEASVTPTIPSIAALLFQQVLGALVFGALVGWLGRLALRGLGSSSVTILATLAMVLGGYRFAEHLGLSAPIAVVMIGLVFGDDGRSTGVDAQVRERLYEFWAVLDELLNLILFALIGLQLLVIDLAPHVVLIGAMSVLLVLLARLISVAIPVALSQRLRMNALPTIGIMTWGGLRGGISIALALSLPPLPGRSVVVSSCYAVVIFSLLIQATTMPWVARTLLKPRTARAA